MYKKKENYKKFLSLLILCTLIFALNFQMNPGFIRKNNNLRSSAVYDPAGIIALWSGPLNTIPAGWKLCDGTGGTINTTNLFVYSTNGTESSGATGGSTSHNHSYSTVPLHDHGVTSTKSTPHRHSYDVPQYYRNVGQPGALITFTALSLGTRSTGSTNPSHSHTMNSAGGTPPFYMSEEENIIPPYYEMAFIEKETNDPTIPIGVIVMWNGIIDTIPAGWELCNGSNGTPDLREKFIRGAPPGENPGTLGGNVSHNHTYTQIPSHSHSIGSNIGGSHSHEDTYGVDRTIGWDLLGLRPVFTPTGGNTYYADVPHTHSVPSLGLVTCTSQNTTNLPPYYKVAFIMNTVVSDALPVGVISMWGDSIANLPPGWNQCNGANGTPDMLDRFPRGIATGEQPGIVGGSDTHRHRYTEVPQHTHTVNSDNMWHRHSYRTASGTTNWGLSGSTSCSSSWGTPLTYSTASSSPSHYHDILPKGDEYAYSSYENSLPPYVKLIYMQKGLSLSNPSPQDGATDIIYDPILSVDINDLEGHNMNVSFYNGASDAMIGWEYIFGGTGTASATWSGLSSGTVYSWYAKADDGVSTTQSDTWFFTTNFAPNVPTNPTPNDLATGISLNPTLSVDVFDNDGDDLTVSFYDASDDSLIDADIVLGGSGTASVTWSNLSSDMICTWYVIADDGLSTTQSSQWTFSTTEEEIVIPPAIPLPGLFTVGLIVMGTTAILSLIIYLRRKKWI